MVFTQREVEEYIHNWAAEHVIRPYMGYRAAGIFIPPYSLAVHNPNLIQECWRARRELGLDASLNACLFCQLCGHTDTCDNGDRCTRCTKTGSPYVMLVPEPVAVQPSSGVAGIQNLTLEDGQSINPPASASDMAEPAGAVEPKIGGEIIQEKPVPSNATVDDDNDNWEASFALIIKLAEEEGGIDTQLAVLGVLGDVQPPPRQEEAPNRAEDPKKAEEPENEPKPIVPTHECLVCTDEYPLERRNIFPLPCTRHYICSKNKCLTASIEAAVKAKIQFSCCGKNVDTFWLAATDIEAVPTQLLDDYRFLIEELSVPLDSRLYCGHCSSYISEFAISREFASSCRRCSHHTCQVCRLSVEKLHGQEKCKQNLALMKRKKEEEEGEEKLKILAKKTGWRQCPQDGCGRWVEKTEGCNHITCKCGFGWCYRCRKEWDERSDCAHVGCANVAAA